MTDILLVVLLLGLANGAISQIITFSGLMEPVREEAAKQAEWFGELVECSLCFGTWTALVMSFCAQWRLTDWRGIDAVLALFGGAFAIHMVGLIAGHAWRALLKLEG